MKKLFLLIGFVFVLSIASTAAVAGNELTITVGIDASEWSSDTTPVAGVIIPVEGGGQLQGNFTVVDRADGVQIALRATDRVDGLLPPATGKKKGVYVAATGFDTGTNNRAEWNYDWHVDLRGTGTTLGDYDLTLTQTFAPKLDIVGVNTAGPFDLTFRDLVGGASTTCSSFKIPGTRFSSTTPSTSMRKALITSSSHCRRSEAGHR